jgi:predicted MFS family arabinose efflux permease
MTFLTDEVLVVKVPINTLAQSRLFIKNSFGGFISRIASCASRIVPTGQTGKVASVTASCVRVVKVLFGACALGKILVRNHKLGDVAVFTG